MSIEQEVDKLDAGIENLVQKMFYEFRKMGKELNPAVHIAYPNPNNPEELEHILAIVDGPPREHADRIRGIARQFGAVWLAFMAEAWASPPVANPNDMTCRPSEHPDRREILTLTVEGPLGSRAVTWLIEDGKLGEPTITNEYEGPLAGLLPKQPTTTTN